MAALVQFVIPVKGLGLGIHEYDFHIDRSFFEHFEEAPIQECDIDLTLVLDKRLDMYILDFDFDGVVDTHCDRCLAEIGLPLYGEAQLVVKFSSAEEMPEEEAELVYINPEATPTLDVSRYVYEFICLSMPIIKAYDCEDDDPRPCDDTMLAYLEQKESPKDDEDDEPGANPLWDELKKLS